MKKFVLFLLVCVLLFLSGCSESNPFVDSFYKGVANAESIIAEDSEYRENFVKSYFQKVAEDDTYAISLYRDTLTDVMYCCYRMKSGYAGGVGFCLMYASDGSPLLYSEWLSLCEHQEDPDHD